MPGLATYADTVIRNSNIITVDPQLPRAQALAIHDGKFVAVGTNGDLENLIGPGTCVLDLSGKTVVPGFIDAHTHVMRAGLRPL